MKKNLSLFGILCLFSITAVQAQIYNFPVSTSLTATTQYTNDEEHMTVAQIILCGGCSGIYLVPSIHQTTTIYSLSNFTFQPGFNYTVSITGSATASGDLANPTAVPVYFGVSFGAAAYSNDIHYTCNNFYDYSTLVSYTQLLAYQGPGWQGSGAVDLMTNFLTGLVGIGAMPSNGASGTSTTTASFTVPWAETGLNIEAYPVLGDPQQFVPVNNGVNNPTNIPVTTSTLNITQITITATCSAPPAPSITIRGIEPLNRGTQMDVTVNTSVAGPYSWYVNNSLVSTTLSAASTINGGSNCNTTNSLKVVVSNGCGSNSASTTYSRPCSGRVASDPTITVAPNPSSGLVTITAPDEQEQRTSTGYGDITPLKGLAANKIYQVRVIDKFGNIRKTIRYPFGDNKVSIDLSGLASDVYTLQIYSNNSWISKPLLLIK